MSSPQQGELRVCLSTPRLGTLAFFLIFMILIPITLISSDNSEYIQYYLPFTVLLASTLTSAGAPDNFQDLYPLFPTSILGFLSANLINFFSLAGILWYIISVGIKSNDKERAVLLGLIIISITYPVATQALPFFIRHGDMFLRRVAPKVRWVGNWHKYFIGFMMIVFLIILQILIIGILTSNGGVTGAINSVNNNVNKL